LEPGKTNHAPPGEITTLDGKTYKGVTVQRVDPDGLTVGYAAAGGGTGAAKIKFKNLPDDLQRQYKYDPDKAAAYEARQTQGMAAWRAQRQKEAEAAKRAASQRAEQDVFEQQQKKRANGNDRTAKKGSAKGNRSDVVRVHIKCEGGENNQLDSIRVERKPARNERRRHRAFNP
jgi:hypothetical protein